MNSDSEVNSILGEVVDLKLIRHREYVDCQQGDLSGVMAGRMGETAGHHVSVTDSCHFVYISPVDAVVESAIEVNTKAL